MAWPKGRPRSPETIAKLSAPKRPLAERYWEKVDKRGPDDCWPWTACLRSDGYGEVGVGNKRSDVAHRVGWKLVNGPISGDGVVDHICHNRDTSCPGGACAHRACQNPKHWRLVSRTANVMAGKGLCVANVAKTHCPEGHAYDEANTYLRPDGGGRDCRKCRVAATARRRRKKNTCEVCPAQISPQSKRCMQHRATRWTKH